MFNISPIIIAATISTSALFPGITSIVNEENKEVPSIKVDQSKEGYEEDFTIHFDLPPINENTGFPVVMTALVEEPTFVDDAGMYTVQIDDTLSTISTKFELELATVKEWNNLQGDLIVVGQKLSVDGQVEPTASQIQQEKSANFEPTSYSESTTPSSSANDVISIANQYLGVPYVFGGTTPNGFDCSGYISYVFKKAGILDTNYNSSGLYAISEKVSTPQVGDLVFFSGTYKEGISHVGIYIGDNKMINASGSKVQITNIHDPYWKQYFTGFGRI